MVPSMALLFRWLAGLLELLFRWLAPPLGPPQSLSMVPAILLPLPVQTTALPMTVLAILVPLTVLGKQ